MIFFFLRAVIIINLKKVINCAMHQAVNGPRCGANIEPDIDVEKELIIMNLKKKCFCLWMSWPCITILTCDE